MYQDQDYIEVSKEVYFRFFPCCLLDVYSILIRILRHAWHPRNAVYLLKSDKCNLECLLTFLLLNFLSSKAIAVQILLLEKIR